MTDEVITGAHKPPAVIEITWCPTCGRNNLAPGAPKGHMRPGGTAYCPGRKVTLTYRLEAGK